MPRKQFLQLCILASPLTSLKTLLPLKKKLPVCGANSLVIQWLELSGFTAEGLGSKPGCGTKILQATQHGH